MSEHTNTGLDDQNKLDKIWLRQRLVDQVLQNTPSLPVEQVIEICRKLEAYINEETA